MTFLSDLAEIPNQLLSTVPAIVFESRINLGQNKFILNYINQGAVELLGLDPARFDPAQFSIADFAGLMHPDDSRRLTDSLAESTAKFARYHEQCRLLLPSGLRWLDIVADPEAFEDGWIFWRGNATDITALKQAKERYWREQERLALATRAAGVGIWEYDVSSAEYRLDARMRELMFVDEAGFERGEGPESYRIAAEAWASLVHADDLPGLLRDRTRALEDGSTYSYEFRIHPPSGGQRYLSAVIQVFRKPDGSADRLLGTAMDITERMELQKQLEHLAAHDALTGLPNRMTFERKLQEACDQADRERREHVLCYMDLDRFKIVNDSAGHAAGDAFLRMIGNLIQSSCSDKDFTARLGGDEFALLLYDCSPAKAEHKARELIDAIRMIRLPWDGKIYDIGASIGLTAIAGEAPRAVDLMSQADVACYAAKAAGRNQVIVYGGRNGAAERHHQEIMVASGIRRAIEANRLELFAQEILTLKAPEAGAAPQTRNIELLLRMTDASGRVLRPGSFIPAAERYDLMGNLDRWVIDNALIEYGHALGQIGDLSVSINLSANSLNDPLFWAFLKMTLEASRLPPERVNFEVTETALINNLDSARNFMSTVRAAGCGIILDDFGTGLSSFNYLKQFPVDGLKIDGSFIRQLKNSPVDRAIVESINDIAHKLGIKTVAEFVEDAETLKIVRAIGVDQAQGYLIGRPLPIGEMIEDRAIQQAGLL
jgi:diguanylate cyclase (GGDEF)-like protein